MAIGCWFISKESKTNRSGYGSVVEVVRKDGTSVKRWVRGDGSYLAANDPRAHFGLGKATEIDSIRVHWLAGECEVWKQSGVDRIVNLREGSGQACPSTLKQVHSFVHFLW